MNMWKYVSFQNNFKFFEYRYRYNGVKIFKIKNKIIIKFKEKKKTTKCNEQEVETIVTRRKIRLIYN